MHFLSFLDRLEPVVVLTDKKLLILTLLLFFFSTRTVLYLLGASLRSQFPLGPKEKNQIS